MRSALVRNDQQRSVEAAGLMWERYKPSVAMSGITATTAKSQRLKSKDSWSTLTDKTFSSSVGIAPNEMPNQTHLDVVDGQRRPEVARMRQVWSHPMKHKSTMQMQQLSHLAATKMLCDTTDQTMGSEPRYHRGLNFHEKVAELAQAIEAEWIVAKYFDRDFDPFASKYKQVADVGNGIEVKHTESGFHLIVYPNDRNTDVAVLVTGKSPDFTIIGWIPVSMAKRPRFKKSTQESWWVNMRDLQPIETLIRSSYGATAI